MQSQTPCKVVSSSWYYCFTSIVLTVKDNIALDVMQLYKKNAVFKIDFRVAQWIVFKISSSHISSEGQTEACHKVVSC